MESGSLIKEAERLLNKEDEMALSLYKRIVDEEPQFSALAYFRMGEICNRLKDPLASFKFHQLAYAANNHFSKVLVKEDHPSYHYEFTNPIETLVEKCPLCGEKGLPYACYNATTSLDFIHGFHPIRLWMCCDDCHHLFAYNYPVQLGELLTNSSFEFNLIPKTNLFSRISPIVMMISQIAPGSRLLEVGVGGGEFSAVAKEFLFDVTGLDIRPKYAEAVSRMLSISVFTEDFQKFHSDERFDVLVMGDVIEHMQDPVGAIRKAHSLLAEQGVLWISTPNFESAFSMVMKEADAMWRIVEHLNYFSFRSLKKWLDIVGFDVVNYNVSGHYNGSMEVTAIKR
jgi:2-polyprenyl-3-methyl-5-hydroxy-6-metoxy-1,4-benzoquinol methylase